MRMRLGILHDPEAQQRLFDREHKAIEEKKRKAEVPTVRTEDEQRKHEQAGTRDGHAGEHKSEERKTIKIRPLSDARAIDLGANFFSEAFIFSVGVAIILLENYRRGSKENARRDEVAERLDTLEEQVTLLREEVSRLRSQHDLPELKKLNEHIKKSKDMGYSWYNPIGWLRIVREDDEDDDEGIPGEVEGSGGVRSQATGGIKEQKRSPVSPEAQTSQGSEEGVRGNKGVSKTSNSTANTKDRLDTVSATKKER